MKNRIKIKIGNKEYWIKRRKFDDSSNYCYMCDVFEVGSKSPKFGWPIKEVDSLESQIWFAKSLIESDVDNIIDKMFPWSK